jgi:hypothetical protein
VVVVALVSVFSAVVVPPVALLAVVVVVSVTPNSSCAKAKEGYCCPRMALDAKIPGAAIEKTAAAISNPLMKTCFVGIVPINQWEVY